MSLVLRSEILKLRTTRTFAGFVVAALGLSLLIAVLLAALSKQVTEDDVREMVGLDASSLFILLLGAVGMTGEWRHRTITSTLLAAPDRRRLMAAKMAAYALAGVVLSLVVTTVVAAVCTAILSARDQPTLPVGEILDLLWRNVLIAGLFGALGVAVGALVRNQVVAIVGLLVLVFVIEPTLSAVAPRVARFGPLLGAPSALAGDAEAGDDLLSPLLGALVMAGWTVATGLAASLLLRRRDVAG